MSVMPSSLKKWMCPNHADHVIVGILGSFPSTFASLPVNHFQPIRRSIKCPRIIEVKHPGMKNNGNIEIIPSAEDLAKETMPYEDVYINNRRYMIPEKIIRLDFLRKTAEFQTAVGKSKAAEKYGLPAFPVSYCLSCLSSCRDVFETCSSSPLTSLTSLTDDEDRQRELEETDEDGDSDSEVQNISRTEEQAAQTLVQISKGLSVSGSCLF